MPSAERTTHARILEETLATGFSAIPNDTLRSTGLVACAILAIELQHLDAARALPPLLEPLSAEVAYNGAGSQGPIAAYCGKLASLLGQHDLAGERLLEALRIAEVFGWTYHRATTRFAMAEARFRRLGRLDAEGRDWLDEATALCTTGGYAIWLAKAEALDAGRVSCRRVGVTPDTVTLDLGEGASYRRRLTVSNARSSGGPAMPPSRPAPKVGSRVVSRNDSQLSLLSCTAKMVMPPSSSPATWTS